MAGFQNCSQFSANSSSSTGSSLSAEQIVSDPPVLRNVSVNDQTARTCADDEVLIQKRCIKGLVLKVPNTSDDLTAIQSTINLAATMSGPVVIALEDRTYTLKCANEISTYCLSLTGSKNLKIKGVTGKTQLLVASPLSGALLFSGSTDVTLQDLSVDYELPPYSQGTIQSIGVDPDDGGAYVIYQVDAGHLQLDDPRLFGVESCKKTESCRQPPGEIFAPNGESTARWILDFISPRKEVPGKPPTLTSLGNRRWKIRTFNSQEALDKFVNIGDKVAFTPMVSHGILGMQSSALNFLRVDVFSAPGAAFTFDNISSSLHLDSANVFKNPGSDRVISANYDAYHITNSSAPFTLINSFASSNGDDYINVTTIGWKVFAKNEDEIAIRPIEGQGISSIREGDFAQFTDTKMTKLRLPNGGNATITSVRFSSDKKSAFLKVNADMSAIEINDTFFNLSTSSPYSVVKENVFGSHRGTIRFRSIGGQFRQNRFLDPAAAIFLYTADDGWEEEGPVLPPPWVSENRVEGGKLRIFGLGWTPEGEY